MELQLSHHQDAVTATFTGQFTFLDQNRFGQLLDLAEQPIAPQLILDVSRLEFIDSAGLGMLLILREYCQKADKPLTLLHPTGQVKKVFNIAKFDEMFKIEPLS